MKRFLALLLAAMMLLSLTACGGEDEKPSGSNDDPPAIGQQQEQNTPDPGTDDPEETPDNGGEETGELSWDELDLPDGFPRLADTVSSFNIDDNGRYSFTWRNTDFETSEAKVNMMCEWANGAVTGGSNGKSTTWKIQNDRVNLIAAYSDEDKFMMLETSVTEGASLSSYLAAHSFTEEDFKPANFKEFSEITTSGEKFGGITQNGSFEIYIEDGTYKQEDAAAWYDAIIKRIVEISAANDSVISDLKNNPITTYDEYAEKNFNFGVPEYPSIGCYFASKLGGSKYVVKITAAYESEENLYRVEFQTMRLIF